jgi:uncharacterized membrane protein
MLPMLKNYCWFVSRTTARLYSAAVADFILDKYSNFVAFFLQQKAGLIFFVTFLHQCLPRTFSRGQKSKDKGTNILKSFVKNN